MYEYVYQKKLPDASVENNPTSYQSFDENGGLILHIGQTPYFKHCIANKNKQRHYWIWSRCASVGKSLNINTVCMYCFAMRTRYYDGFWNTFDEQAQFVFIDEYGNGDSKLDITDLNLMCDGGYKFNTKGKQPQALIDTNAIIVIMSNKPPEEVYTIWNKNKTCA